MEVIKGYRYKGFWGCECRCDIEANGNVVIATERDDNEGTSITNAAEALAAIVAEDFGIDKENLVWIEHYPARGQGEMFAESFDLVEFDLEGGKFRNPRWKRITKEEARAILEKGASANDNHKD